MFEIRELTPDELLQKVNELQEYSFMSSPPFEKDEDWIESVRTDTTLDCLAAFQDNEPAAVVVSADMNQNVRGKLFPAGGVWGVATDPVARRKGLVRQLIGSLLAKTRAKGHAFTLLYPFKESFYGRLGYVAFPVPREVRFSPQALAPLLKTEPGETVTRVLIRDGIEIYLAYLHEMQTRTHGMALFTHPGTFMAKKNRAWLAVARSDGAVTGLMLYRNKGEEDSDMFMKISRFYTSTIQARYQLLQYIALHADQVTEVQMLLPPAEQPETWMPDLELKVKYFHAPPMARVLDVTRLAGMPVGEGSFTVSVSDPLCPWNEGNWSFEGRAGELVVLPAAAADCSLTIQGLTSLVFGCRHPGEFSFHGWGDPAPDVQARMLAVFPPAQPYMHEQF